MDYGRIRDYLYSLEPEPDERLEELRAYAEAERVPIIRRETESLLRTLIRARDPVHILEIGTAIGYSALVMAGCTGGDILTMENYEKRIPIARSNIERAGLSDRIRLMEGDAGELLAGLSVSFDFIFLDAAKGQYINWLPDIVRLMDRGAILFADNVLQDLTVLESRFTVERRERTTHSRMREFLYAIKHDERLESSVLPIGDGVSISVRR